MQKSITSKALSMLMAFVLCIGTFSTAAIGMVITTSLATTTVYASSGTTYTVTFDTDGGSAVPDQTVDAGERLSNRPRPTKANYTFVTWFTDPAKTTIFRGNDTVNSDMTLYASWFETSRLGGRNYVGYIDAYTDYVNLEGGMYAGYAAEETSNVAFYLGNGLTAVSAVSADDIVYSDSNWLIDRIEPEEEYHYVADSEVAIANQYPQIKGAFEIELSDTLAGVNKFTLELYHMVWDENGDLVVEAPYYVYGPTLNYLGMVPVGGSIEVSRVNKYYFATSPLPSNDSNSGGGSSSNSRPGASRPDGSTTSSSQSTGNAASTSSNVTSSGTVSPSAVKSELQSALTSAGTKETAKVTVKNAQSISPSTLKTLAADANQSGKNVVLNADTTDANGNIQARLYVEPEKLMGLSSDLKLGVHTDPAKTARVQNAFEKFFDNNVAVVQCEQQGSFGASLKMAVKVDLSKLDTKSLVFYSHDPKTNTFSQIPNTAYTIDKNGYLVFTTEKANNIIITDKPLQKK